MDCTSLSRWLGDYWLAPSAFAIAEPRLATINHRNSSPQAMKLFIFLCKKNSACENEHKTFPIDRRALGLPTKLGDDHKPTPIQIELGMTESEIRTAIRHLYLHALIEVVHDPDGVRYQSVIEKTGKRAGLNGVYRLPIQYRFSSEIRNVFRYLKGRFAKYPKRKEIDSKILNLKYEVPLLGQKIVRPSEKPDLFTPARIDATRPNMPRSGPTRVSAMANPVHAKPFPTLTPRPEPDVVVDPMGDCSLPTDTTPAHLRGIVSSEAQRRAQTVKKPFKPLQDVAMNDGALRGILDRVAQAIDTRRVARQSG